MAESTIGLFETEVIDVMGPRNSVGRVEWDTLTWVNSVVVAEKTCTTQNACTGKNAFITPQNEEDTFYETLNAAKQAAEHVRQKIADKPDTVQIDTNETLTTTARILRPFHMTAEPCAGSAPSVVGGGCSGM